MKNQPLVSVFLPTYNQQKFVAASIDSVVNQDYDNLEIVIGDDCSKDNTWQIVQEYQSRYPEKIKAFRNHKNFGITGNCNEILKRCTGKYVAFTAGDDLFLPGKISRQVESMSRNENIILCYHNVEVFQSQTNKTLNYWNLNSGKSKAIHGSVESVAAAVVKTANSFIGGMSVMVQRSAIPVSGYDMRIPHGSDWLMWIEILANANADSIVEYMPDVLARYRRHESNITGSGYSDIDDPHVTLAIIENRYTKLIKSIDECRILLRYSKGVRLLLAERYSDGRKMILASSSHLLHDWRYAYWLAVGFFPFLLKLRREK